MAISCDHADERLQENRDVLESQFLGFLKHGDDVDLISCPKHTASTGTVWSRSVWT